MEKIKSAIYLLEEANKSLNQNEFYDWVQDKIKLLKAMEKEQVINAFKGGMDYPEYSVAPNWNNEWDEYYNQTYNQNK